ncbi:hypothetical protein MLD38_001088 [Melastoma candidum]|uniref:Uncharacterized protein n=1 Tax=Melastoma candidum TaxID=119954 RepID=A0ACB9SFG4_9MYRT|nr:hypothetical protein MLD38_001088 [Melastoma candidum]
MGGKLSTEENCGESPSSSYRSTSTHFAGGGDGGYPQTSPTYGQQGYSYPVQPAYPPPQLYAPPPPPQQHQQYYPPAEDQGYGGGRRGQGGRKRLDKRYSRIADNYRSLEEVTEALARAGLESSNLIVGIDFTKSNEWTGARSFNKQSLHHIGEGLNPYEQAISIIGKTLAAFDEDNLIPCFGFGDASTHDQDVFSFYPEEICCNGFEEVLYRYREIVPQLRLAGPTSFAPIIEMAMTIVEKSGGQYHVLLIIADGQVTRSVDTERGKLSPQEQKTVDAIVQASKLPLSIILVGVGDGPWDTMQEFDDNIPAREFDNFQFVNFTEIMSKNVPLSRKETEFALTALMEIPSQYKATIELDLLGRKTGNAPQRVPLPPPQYGFASNVSKPPRALNFQPSIPHSGRDMGMMSATSPYYGDSQPISSAPPYYQDQQPFSSASPYHLDSQPISSTTPAPPVASSANDEELCPICFTNHKDMAFGCGHQTCCECGSNLDVCPICRSAIHTRIKLY